MFRWTGLAARVAMLVVAAVCSAVCFQAEARAADGARPVRKLWVFFRDRDERRAKGSLATPTEWLSDRAAARRRVRGRGALVSDADLPIDPACRDAVVSSGGLIVATSRWLNAVSVLASPADSARIAALPCVASMAPVSARAPEPDRAPGSRELAAPRPRETAADSLDYGASRFQLEQIEVPALHARGLTGAGVLVGILDSGFERAHPAFAKTSIVAERDFVHDDDNTADSTEIGENVSDHGTAVFSVLGGFAPGDLIGAAYGASYVLAKTEDVVSEYAAEEDFWVEGLEWEESLGVDVVSSSLGYLDFPGRGFYDPSQMDGMTAVTTRAAQMAVDRGVVVVNAMGNERQAAWHIMAAPADARGVISVGGIDEGGALAGFSSVGPTADGRIKPDVVALALNVRAARADPPGIGQTPYTVAFGTSFATPLVAGVAALILEAHPEFAPSQVCAALHETSTRSTAPDTLLGYGRVRAAAAVSLDEPDPAACEPVFVGARTRVALRTRHGGVFAPAHGDLDWSFDLPEAGRVTVRIYDVSGRLVATPSDGDRQAGLGLELSWDGRDADGDAAPPGVYVLRLRTPLGSAAARVVLVR